MKSFTILAALFSATASAGLIRRTEPDCDEEVSASPTGYAPPSTSGYAPSPSGYAPSAYGGTNGTSGSGSNSALICGASSITNYTVASGDTLTTIAKSFKSGICDIASLNNITDPNFIELGQLLQIPVDCTTPDNKTCLTQSTAVATETCVPGLGSTYTVKSGDSLSAIASNFKITLDSLEGANPNITNPNFIEVGQVISIPICPGSQCDVVGTYTIKSGDLFYDLAAEYHTTVGQIESLNPTVDPTKTQPGDVIILPQDCHNVTTAAV